jgi:D-glycero-alpha-D-manno-heptose 1-phosphate guanylyltransferase
MEGECIILAGGLGTRLRSVVNEVPKCMAPVNGKPFLFYLLKYLSNQDINKIILAVGYKHEIIIDWCHQNIKTPEIIFSVENYPLGTGGAIKSALQYVNGKSVFIINGDTFFPVSLRNLLLFHQENNADLTITLKPMEHFNRYGSVEIAGKRIIVFKEKQYVEKGLINGGICCLQKRVLLNNQFPEKFSFENDFMEKEIDKQYFAGYISDEYFIDIGVPEDYARAQTELKEYDTYE